MPKIAQKTAGRDPVFKTLQLLRILMEEPNRSFGVREMAAIMGIAPSSGHRLMEALVYSNFARRVDDGRIALGLDVIRMSHIILARVPIREAALRNLRAVWNKWEEQVAFGVYDPLRRKINFSIHIPSNKALRYVIDNDSWFPVYAGASCLAVMAFLTEQEQKEIAKETSLKPFTDNTLTTWKELKTTLENIRRDGYAQTQGQRTVGAVGIATPVFDLSGKIIGSVSISIPATRYDKRKKKDLVDALLACSAAIQNEIGAGI